jgi:quercetin 2,3-dioxygenase
MRHASLLSAVHQASIASTKRPHRETQMLFKAPQSKLRHEMGPFTIITNLPGRAIPNHWDHGYGPLARFDESILEPGGFIPMHEHRNDEIISYVSDGMIHHADKAGGNFPISPSQIMVMNAGNGFWHEEQTKPDGETARVMQIFVRPHTVDLAPSIQLRNLEAPVPNTWRFLVGPENSDAPAIIRNDVRLYDIHLKAGVRSTVPSWDNWDSLVHVYRGNAKVNGTALAQAEGGLLVNEISVVVMSESAATLLAFLINRRATLTHSGNIGR